MKKEPQVKVKKKDDGDYEVEIIRFQFLRATNEGELIYKKMPAEIAFKGSIIECESYSNLFKSGIHVD